MATISKGITLTYQMGEYTAATNVWESTSDQINALTNLLEIPEVGASESGYEQIDITTLADSKMKYMNGLETASEPEALEFKFLYEKEQFSALERVANGDGYHGHWDAEHKVMNAIQWTITLPDGSTCKFLGKPGIRLEGVGVNAAITYIVSITPEAQYEFVWDFGTAASAE